MGKSDGLRACDAARELAEMILELVRKLPSRAPAALRSQLTAAALSVSANLAEGFARGTPREKIQFSRISSGSLAEAQSYLKVCINEHFIDEKTFYRPWNRSVVVARMIARIIAKLERQPKP
jgi:four helix bundle protein